MPLASLILKYRKQEGCQRKLAIGRVAAPTPDQARNLACPPCRSPPWRGFAAAGSCRLWGLVLKMPGRDQASTQSSAHRLVLSRGIKHGSR